MEIALVPSCNEVIVRSFLNAAANTRAQFARSSLPLPKGIPDWALKIRYSSIQDAEQLYLSPRLAGIVQLVRVAHAISVVQNSAGGGGDQACWQPVGPNATFGH